MRKAALARGSVIIPFVQRFSTSSAFDVPELLHDMSCNSGQLARPRAWMPGSWFCSAGRAGAARGAKADSRRDVLWNRDKDMDRSWGVGVCILWF